MNKSYDIYNTIIRPKRQKQVKGKVVGVEIEVEGNKFFKDNDYAPLRGSKWKYVHDGSLRGNDNAEYVFKKPLSLDDANKAVDSLWEMFEKFGSVLDESNRTSVHVHLNVQDWHANRFCAFVSMYMIVEDILTHWCGDHRVGNMFCLRTSDAAGIITKIKNVVKTDFGSGVPNGFHYSGLNIHSLYKFGTIEVRTMRGITNPETLKTWLGILERIYDASEDYTQDPRMVVEGFSGYGHEVFVQKILGDYTTQVLNESGMNEQEISESLLQGVRNAQEVAYCRDWSMFQAGQPGKSAPFAVTRKTPSPLFSASDVNSLSDFVETYGASPAPLPSISSEETISIGEDPEF